MTMRSSARCSHCSTSRRCRGFSRSLPWASPQRWTWRAPVRPRSARGSASISFSRCSAAAAWARSTARTTRGSAATSRSRCCRPRSPRTPIVSPDFEREARLLASLNHPNIGTIHGFEEGEGVRALVLELVEGETLADRIAQSGPLPIRRGARDRAPDRRRARSRARQGHRPSRSETGQHQDHARRRRQGAGLRAGEERRERQRDVRRPRQLAHDYRRRDRGRT